MIEYCYACEECGFINTVAEFNSWHTTPPTACAECGAEIVAYRESPTMRRGHRDPKQPKELWEYNP